MVASSLRTPPPREHLALVKGLSSSQLRDIAHWLGLPNYMVIGTGTCADSWTRPQILDLLRELR